MEMKRIVIIGGGITGLTAAYYTKKAMEELAIPFDLTVLEASDRAGGKINSVRKDDFVIERGADSFLERKTAAIQLVEELALKDHVVHNSTGQAHVLVGNTLHKIPAGSFMGIPLYEEVLKHSNLISEAGKQRIMEELTLPKGDPKKDQSLGYFLRERFGDELIENLIEPLLSGIYSSDVDKMSLMASFPHFYHLEQKYGSLILGLRETLPKKKANTGEKKGQFLSFENGLDTLIHKLVEKIGEERIWLEHRVEHIAKENDTYQIQLQNGKCMEADGVFLAVPHSNIPGMFKETDAFRPLNEIKMSSVANVVLAYENSAIKNCLEGTGFVVSRNSDYRMTACTWTHRKWPQTTPDGKALLRVYVGKPSDQEIVQLSDEEIVAIVRKELQEIMNINVIPDFTLVTRWNNIMPQYEVGHPSILEQVEQNVAENLPGVYYAGSSYKGIGIPDCIHQAKESVNKLMEYITTNNN